MPQSTTQCTTLSHGDALPGQAGSNCSRTAASLLREKSTSGALLPGAEEDVKKDE